MIDIPIGKALVAVEAPMPNKCEGCYLTINCVGQFCCSPYSRKEGKGVIFKLVDLREEYNRGFADGYNSGSILGET